MIIKGKIQRILLGGKKALSNPGWLNYAAVGIFSLGMGYFLYSAQMKEIQPPLKQQPATTTEGLADEIPPPEEQSNLQQPAPLNSVETSQTKLMEKWTRLHPELYKSVQLENQSTLLKELFMRIAAHNPVEAAALIDDINDYITKHKFTSILTGSWASTDPKAAYQWIVKRKETINYEDYDFYLESILSPLATKEPAYAWSIIKTIQNPAQKDIVIMRLAEEWVSKDPVAAFDWLEVLATDDQISSSKLKECYSSTMTKYTEVDPAGAAQVIEKLESQNLQSRLIKPAVYQLAQKDLDEAMMWVLKLRRRSIREAGIKEIISGYTSQQPEAVLNYALKHSGLSKEGIDLMSMAFASVCEQNPNMALQKFDKVPHRAHPKVIESIARTWLCNNEKAASAWLKKQPSGPSLDAGASVAALHYLKKKPVMAFDWANKVSNPEKRSELLNELIECADEDNLKDIYLAVQNAALKDKERTTLQAKLDKRLREEYATLVLP